MNKFKVTFCKNETWVTQDVTVEADSFRIEELAGSSVLTFDDDDSNYVAAFNTWLSVMRVENAPV